mmetsp:Transcript_29697/g.40799  ORF Transcript_29697/g.40799 Transcript_29697/m.40799 type:complete len:917 (+) Transcript_29697:64-2814(+)
MMTGERCEKISVQLHQRKFQGIQHNWRKILCHLFLIFCSALCGFIAYRFLFKFIRSNYLNQLKILTNQIQSSLDEGLTHNLLASQSLAETFNVYCPSYSNWPQCSIPRLDFMKLIRPLLLIGFLKDISIVPILYPNDTASSFEEYAFRMFEADKGYPKNYGVSSIGSVIYSLNTSKGFPGVKYHDTTGETSFSKFKIITPNFLCASCAVMCNLHSVHNRGIALDSIIDAFANGQRNVSTVTTFVQAFEDKSRPASANFYPIAPSQSSSILVGFVRVLQYWDEAFKKASPMSAQGIDFILSDSKSTYTFTITQGRKVSLKGEGDLHDVKFESYRLSYPPFCSDEYSAYTVIYYPNSAFFPRDIYLQPLVGSITIVLVLLLLELVFAVYSYYLERQLQQKQEALDSKRSFVRFISHEIRTPLNTVCLGLKVLQDEANATVAESVLEAEPAAVTARLELEVAHEVNAEDSDWIVSADSMLLEEVVNWIGFMKDIEESANNAVEVLNELMSYDKIEMKTMQIEKEPVAIWDLLASSIKPFYIQAKERGLQLKVQLEESSHEESLELVLDRSGRGSDANRVIESAAVLEERLHGLQHLMVVGDSVRLTQVFRNVISNALKFSYPGTDVIVRTKWLPDRMESIGAELLEELKSSRPMKVAGSLRVDVQDSGPGLPPENLQHLFKEGVQFDANKLQAGGGSGLGLWIAKGIVHLHGGEISAFSRGRDTGATFSVELPVVQYVEQDSNEPHSENLGGCEDPVSEVHIFPFGKLAVQNVLVVDDAATNRKMMCRVLRNIGCKCSEAYDGTECLEIMRGRLQSSLSETVASNCPASDDESVVEAPIDLILMDSEMPIMKGPETVAELRRMGVNCLIFGCTGNVLQSDHDHFTTNGADFVLTKPLSLERLSETLKSFHCVSIGDRIL